MKDASHYNKLKTLQAKHVGDICDSKKGNHVADENAKTRRQISYHPRQDDSGKVSIFTLTEKKLGQQLTFEGKTSTKL